MDPIATMPYNGSKHNAISRSSAKKAALLLFLASHRRPTAMVAMTAKAMPARINLSRSGLFVIVAERSVCTLVEESEDVLLKETRRAARDNVHGL